MRLHVVQFFRHEIGQFLRHGDVAIAVGVEDRVQLDAVFPRPLQIGNYLRLTRRRPIVHRTRGGHARPREEDLLDPLQVRGADT